MSGISPTGAGMTPSLMSIAGIADATADARGAAAGDASAPDFAALLLTALAPRTTAAPAPLPAAAAVIESELPASESSEASAPANAGAEAPTVGGISIIAGGASQGAQAALVSARASVMAIAAAPVAALVPAAAQAAMPMTNAKPSRGTRPGTGSHRDWLAARSEGRALPDETAGSRLAALSPAGTKARAVDAETAPAGDAAAALTQGTDESSAAIAAQLANSGVPMPAGMDTLRVRADLDSLSPEFRARVEKVVWRMRQETGHAVTVAETRRSPERQAQLFEQGRTRAGEVVTWTLDSEHLTGHAADLVVDGSFRNPAAYRQLQRIAREEGLRTLGLRDPGHVELDSSGAGAGQTSARRGVSADAFARLTGVRVASMTAASPASAQAQVATPARVAQAARVATVAQVAVVARVAQPGQPAFVRGTGHVSASAAAQSGATRLTTGAPRGAMPAVAPAATAAAGTAPAAKGAAAVAAMPATPSVAGSTRMTPTGLASRGSAAAKGSQPVATPAIHAEPAAVASVPRSQSPGPLAEEKDPVESGDRAAASEPAATPARNGAERSMPRGAEENRVASRQPLIDATPLVARSTAAERVERIAMMRDDAASQPMSRMTLQVDGPEGGQDRIRVDVRGTSVDASIDTSTAAAADRLSSRVTELRQALERHGLSPDTVQVTSVAPRAAISAADPARVAGSLLDADARRTAGSADTNANSTPFKDRGGNPDRDDDRQQPGESRHRSRREHRGDRQS